MKSFERLSELLPNYKIHDIKTSVSIKESDQNAKVKEVKLINGSFISIDNKLIKDFSGFFNKAKSPEILLKDCDGIVFCTEKKCIYLVELKSRFDSKKIYEAQIQIISSYIKLNILLNTIKDYDKDEYNFIGYIVSLKPDDNQVQALSKLTMSKDQVKYARFALSLALEGKFTIDNNNCIYTKDLQFNDKCIFENFHFHYIGISQNNVEIDIAQGVEFSS